MAGSARCGCAGIQQHQERVGALERERPDLARRFQRVQCIDADLVHHVDLAAEEIGPGGAHRFVGFDDHAVDQRPSGVVAAVRPHLDFVAVLARRWRTARCRWQSAWFRTPPLPASRITASSRRSIGNVEARRSVSSRSRSDRTLMSATSSLAGPSTSASCGSRMSRMIRGVHRCPVVKCHRTAQLDPPAEPVGGRRPALGEAWRGAAVPPDADQPLQGEISGCLLDPDLRGAPS